MYKLEYRITTLSPVVLATNGGETHLVSTREFISGTTILGMCAARYIKKNTLGNAEDNKAYQDETFYKWFLNGSLCFCNAYIDSVDDRGDMLRNVPVPISVRHQKAEKMNAVDLLFVDQLFQDTETQTSALNGFGRIDGRYLFKQPVRKSLNFHHQHDPATGTVKKGIFFNYQSIDEGQTFTGEIIGDKEELLEFKKEFANEKIFYIGRSKNTQYGKIRVEFILRPCELTFQDNRISPEGALALTLISPLIIYNKFGFTTTDYKELERILKIRIGEDVQIKKTFVNSEDIENHVTVWQLRKPSEACFKAGSCFFITGLREEYQGRLKDLLATGLGERRKEGFGRISFSVQNAVEKVDRLNVKDPLEVDITPPEKIPKQTEDILKIIIKDGFRQAVKKEAIAGAGNFTRLSSGSLLARLQSFLKEGDRNGEKFKRTLSDNLRKSARDKLEKCNNGKQTLFDFLQMKSISINNLLKQNDNFRKELDRILSEKNLGVNFQASILSESFEDKLLKIYFETFLTTMRKGIKILDLEGRVE